MCIFFFSSRRRHTRCGRDWSSDVCSSDLVDGVYTADPEKDPQAVKYDKISFDEVYKQGLKIMDLTATAMCKENKLPVLVFNMDRKGNLKKVLMGEGIGTLVHP